MPATNNHQLNLPLELAEKKSSLSDSTRDELVKELANLIFLFWQTTNDETTPSEDITNE